MPAKRKPVRTPNRFFTLKQALTALKRAGRDIAAAQQLAVHEGYRSAAVDLITAETALDIARRELEFYDQTPPAKANS